MPQLLTHFRIACILIILAFASACQATQVPDLPTLAPTLPQQLIVPRATQALRPVATPLPSSTPAPPTLPSSTPRIIRTRITLPTEPQHAALPTAQASVSAEQQDAAASATAVLTRAPGATTFQVGLSVEGRAIWGWRLGSGDTTLLLVGGVHTGFESNTVMLLNELIAHYESTPADILPGVTLVLIPVLNPDGLLRGRRAAGRFNANNVDLNRNWGCEWSSEAYWQTRRVNPGQRAFSEPETQALGQLIRDLRPAAAIFYHSAAAGVFAGQCEGGHGSDELAAVIGEAAGYSYGQPFTAYRVTGTAANWVDGQGIPAVDLELSTTRETEFIRNLRAIQAVQQWALSRDSSSR